MTTIHGRSAAEVPIITTEPVSPTRGPLSRRQILDAAAACFAESGYDGMTIRAIAGRLDCSVGSIYRYFADKRDLLIACAERGMAAMVADAQQGRDSFADSCRRYVEAASAQGELYRLWFWLEGGVPALIERWVDAWAERLGDATEARRRWALAHGAALLGLRDDELADHRQSSFEERMAAPREAAHPPNRQTAETDDVTLL